MLGGENGLSNFEFWNLAFQTPVGEVCMGGLRTATAPSFNEHHAMESLEGRWDTTRHMSWGHGCTHMDITLELGCLFLPT